MPSTQEYNSPALDFVMRLEVEIGSVIEIGPTRNGQRRIIPITGGRFNGPQLSGRVLAGGGDWQTIRADGVTDLRATYAIETDAGARIEIDNRGYRHGPDAVLERIAAGEGGAPDSYYFQTAPVFITAEPALDWLNRTVFVGSAQRFAAGVVVDVFAVRPRGFRIE